MTARSAPQAPPAGTLRESYQALVEQIPAVFYINAPDTQATTLFVSPQTQEMLGVPQSAWFDGRWSDHVHPDDEAQMTRNYQQMLVSASVGIDEYRFIRPDGSVVWIHDRVTIIRNEDGTPRLVQGVMFDVTEQKEAEALLHRQARLMEKVDAISRRFSDLVLGGTGVGQVLDTLAGIVNNPVVFEDTAHQVVALAQHTTPLDALLERWEDHDDDAAGTDASGGDADCSWITVRVRDEPWGRIHLLGVESPIDELDRLALDRAGAAVGLALMSGRDATALADGARSDLIADLWQGRWRTARDVLARARSLGANLREPRLTGLVVEVGEISAGQAPYDNPATRRRALEHLLAATRSAVADAGVPGLCAVVGSLVIAILGLPDDPGARTRLERMADGVLRRVEDRLPGVLVTVGASRPTPPEELRRALTEASEAAAHGQRTERRPGLHHVDDIGLRLLLGLLGDGPELARFVESELGALLNLPDARATPLLDTLRAYAGSGFHKARAAETLHIERRSLYYRLARAERLLGRSLADPAAQLRLGVALQGLDLLRQRSALSRPGPAESP